MRFLLSLALAAVALALPGFATAESAGGATPLASLEARDVPLGARRSLAVAAPVGPFTMIGLHWRGSGSVVFRTRSAAGRWSSWQLAGPEAEDLPDGTSPEAGADPGWHVGNPYWTGPANRLEVRTSGRVARVRAYYVRSSPAQSDGSRAGEPNRVLAAAGRGVAASPRGTPPPLVTRTGWGANVFISKPSVTAPAVRFVVIHHTAGSSAYAPQDSAAIVRGIQLYHVSGNGWNDIGYNFLVDKFGQIFEGRNGGIDRAVIGAHAVGFNAGSVGIAVIGSYGKAGISKAAQDAISALVAWRLDLAHVDPLSTLTWASGGNGRFPKGIPVFLRTVSGHRDTGFTDCPGDALYRGLDALAARTAATGLPKIYAPAVAGRLGAAVRFTARLSGYGKWRITVTDPAGTTVARAGGIGLDVDWTWDASRVDSTSAYRWLLESGSALPASGTVGRRAAAPPAPATTPATPTTTGPATTTAPATTTTPQPPPAPAVSFLTALALSATTLSPNGDGVDDTATVSYTLTRGAFVTAFVLDHTGAVVVQTLFTDQKQSARAIGFPWSPAALPDGSYRFIVAARLPTGEQSTAGVDVLVVRSLAAFSAVPAAFSPNGDGSQDTLTFSFTLARPGLVALRILLPDGSAVALPFTGQLQAGSQQIVWDGTGVAGRVADGAYTAQVTVVDGGGNLAQQAQITVDTVAPVLTLLSGPELRFSLSEAAAVTVLVDGRQSTQVAGPGDFQLPPPAIPPTLISAVATDAAGNTSVTLAWP